jgi:hypothetical protein
MTKSTKDTPTPPLHRHHTDCTSCVHSLLAHEHRTTRARRNHRHAYKQLARPRLACTTDTCLNCERLDDEGGRLYTEGRAWWGMEVSRRTDKALTQTIVYELKHLNKSDEETHPASLPQTHCILAKSIKPQWRP